VIPSHFRICRQIDRENNLAASGKRLIRFGKTFSSFFPASLPFTYFDPAWQLARKFIFGFVMSPPLTETMKTKAIPN